MNAYLKDVLDQPNSIRNAFVNFTSAENLKMMKEIADLKYDKILFTGMGSSHYACYCASIHLNQQGFTSIVKSTSQLLHYEMDLTNKSTLLFIVSQSGESAEIVNLLGKNPEACAVAAITNNPQSTLAKAADYTFILNVDDEESVTTRTYVSSLVLIDLIAKSITGQLNEETKKSFIAAMDNMEKCSANYRNISDRIEAFLGLPSYLCIIGRGFSYSTVFSGGLFVREVAKFPCISIDSGEFRHGPMEMVDENFTGIVMAPEGVTYDTNCKLAINIADKGGKVILITNRPTSIDYKGIMIIQLNPVDEFFSPIADIIPIQLVANYIAECKKLEVGKFRWSSKVTSIE